MHPENLCLMIRFVSMGCIIPQASNAELTNTSKFGSSLSQSADTIMIGAEEDEP